MCPLNKDRNNAHMTGDLWENISADHISQKKTVEALTKMLLFLQSIVSQQTTKVQELPVATSQFSPIELIKTEKHGCP